MANQMRTIDDLELTEAGERARREAREEVAAMLAATPTVRPLPPPPESRPAHLERHTRFMQRVFDAHRGHPTRRYTLSVLRGTTPGYRDVEQLAWELGGENEAVPDACLPVYPEPEVNGGTIGGTSVTCIPRRFDPSCPMWGDPLNDPEHPRPDTVGAAERSGLADVEAAVAEWLETLYEPLSVRELAELTEYTLADVARAVQALHGDGQIACQVIRSGARVDSVWVWRRLR